MGIIDPFWPVKINAECSPTSESPSIYDEYLTSSAPVSAVDGNLDPAAVSDETAQSVCKAALNNGNAARKAMRNSLKKRQSRLNSGDIHIKSTVGVECTFGKKRKIS